MNEIHVNLAVLALNLLVHVSHMEGEVDFTDEFRALGAFSVGSTALAMDLLVASDYYIVALALLVIHGTVCQDVARHMDRLDLFRATKRACPTQGPVFFPLFSVDHSSNHGEIHAKGVVQVEMVQSNSLGTVNAFLGILAINAFAMELKEMDAAVEA